MRTRLLAFAALFGRCSFGSTPVCACYRSRSRDPSGHPNICEPCDSDGSCGKFAALHGYFGIRRLAHSKSSTSKCYDATGWLHGSPKAHGHVREFAEARGRCGQVVRSDQLDTAVYSTADCRCDVGRACQDVRIKHKCCTASELNSVLAILPSIFTVARSV